MQDCTHSSEFIELNVSLMMHELYVLVLVVSLHKNKLGDKGSIALGEALEHCTELQSLV